MSEEPKSDWDPRSADVLADQIAAYDALRARCPVAHSEYLQWSVLRHADVMQVLLDHETFSSAVSSYPSVPNGMDPPEHTSFRRLIEPYFAPQHMQAFEPRCRAIAHELAASLPKAGEVELINGFAQDFALRIQCAFMGWSADLHEPLRQWTHKNHKATLAGLHAAKAEVALEFDGYIRGILETRRAEDAVPGEDPTDRLLNEQVDGRPLSDEEIVSILRNWTVGELGTIAASVGIVTHYLAARPELQRQLREDLSLLPAAIDEILRIDAPLIANRRVTTREVELGGRQIEAGERLTLLWASANRDEQVFGDPDAFHLDRDPSLNLLYGAGIHVCPGAPLARLELRIVMEELLTQTRHIALLPDQPPVRACYPAGGFSELPLRIG